MSLGSLLSKNENREAVKEHVYTDKVRQRTLTMTTKFRACTFRTKMVELEAWNNRATVSQGNFVISLEEVPASSLFCAFVRLKEKERKQSERRRRNRKIAERRKTTRTDGRTSSVTFSIDVLAVVVVVRSCSKQVLFFSYLQARREHTHTHSRSI